MASDTNISIANQTRATRQLIKQAGASLAGRPRGQDRRVRAGSVDVNDRRADVFRPIGGGTVKGGLQWADDLIRTAEEFDRHHKEKGKRGPLQANGIRVLTVLLKNFADYKTGRLDPQLTEIMRRAGLSKNAVIDALKRLKAHGFLSWVRRSKATDAANEFGRPQREQTSNAYHFPLTDLAKGVRRFFLDLRERRRQQAQQAPAPSPHAALATTPAPSADLANTLAALGASISHASSQ